MCHQGRSTRSSSRSGNRCRHKKCIQWQIGRRCIGSNINCISGLPSTSRQRILVSMWCLKASIPHCMLSTRYSWHQCNSSKLRCIASTLGSQSSSLRRKRPCRLLIAGSFQLHRTGTQFHSNKLHIHWRTLSTRHC